MAAKLSFYAEAFFSIIPNRVFFIAKYIVGILKKSHFGAFGKTLNFV